MCDNLCYGQLETERLKLRHLRPSDEDMLFAMDSNDLVQIYLGEPSKNISQSTI